MKLKTKFMLMKQHILFCADAIKDRRMENHAEFCDHEN